MNYFKKHMFDKFLSRKSPVEEEPAVEEEEVRIDPDKADELFTLAEFDEKSSERIAAPRYSYWKSVWKTFFGSKFTVFVAILVILVISFAFIYPSFFSDYDPMVAPHINDSSWKYRKPFTTDYEADGTAVFHIFGTDNIGNEVFDVVWEGARNSLIVSLAATAINMVIGITVGALWGFSKKMDKWMIEIYNVVSNVPFLLLAMILSYVMKPGFVTLIFIMTVTDWIFVAYFIRTQVMIIRDREYNLASKCLGTRTGTMITKNILPYLISVIMTYISREVPVLISYEVFLSYMGLGIGSQYASLGRTISSYTPYMRGTPHLFWIPVFILAMISISLYIVGQKLADAADPRTHR